MYETAIYTDVRSADSLDGRGGFNYQSASPGFSGTDRSVGESRMLHQVGAALSTEESFAYRQVGGRFYFSRGKDLGATLSGRPGNQITEIVVTGDAADIQPYTPAQILGATTWSLVPRPDNVSEQWAAPPSIGADLENFEAMSWIWNDPRRREFFPAVLSALEARSTGRNSAKVVLVHSEPRTVLRWLAAASLLLNDLAVRSLSLRGLTTDPNSAQADIVACPPGLGTDALAGAVVCDLENLRGGAPGLSFGVERTLALLDEDLDDGVEIVSRARRWDPAVGERSAFWASEFVEGRLSGDAETQSTDMVVRLVEDLARGGFGEDLEVYQQEFGNALKRCRMSSEEDALLLARAAAQTRSGGNDRLTEILLAALAEELIEHPRSFVVCAQELLATGQNPWPGSPSLWAERLSEIARRLPEGELPEAFALAGYLQSALDADLWDRREGEYALYLVSHPEDVARTEGLWNGSRIREMLRSQLLRTLESEVGYSMRPIATGGGHFGEFVGGSWKDLVRLSSNESGPTSNSVLGWQKIADFAAKDPKERRSVLSKSGTEFSAGSWKSALADTSPADHPKLWKAWIEACGTNEDFERFVVQEVDQDLATDSPGHLTIWSGLLQTMMAAQATLGDRRRDALVQHKEQVDQRLEEVPTISKQVAGWFSSRTKKQDKDHGTDQAPPGPDGTAPESRRNS